MTMQELTTFLANHPLPSIAVGVVLLILIVIEVIRSKNTTRALTPLQTTQMINHEHAVIIDLRPTDAYHKGHIIGAQSLSSKEAQPSNKKLEKAKSKPLIFVCALGAESQKIAASLIKQGYNAYALAGGMRAWNAAQMPLVKE